jgi:adenine/guanine phosphoribosyltransferase-like PRPP-binding protein
VETVSNVTDGGINIKELRHKLTTKKALSDQNRLKADQRIEDLKQYFAAFNEDKIAILESKGIAIRTLLGYDLDRVYIEEEYHKEFRELFIKVLKDIELFLLRESGD